MVSRKKQILKRAGALLGAFLCLISCALVPASAFSTLDDISPYINLLNIDMIDFQVDYEDTSGGVEVGWVSFPFAGRFVSPMSSENVSGGASSSAHFSGDAFTTDYYIVAQDTQSTDLGTAQVHRFYYTPAQIDKSMQTCRLQSESGFILTRDLWDVAADLSTVYIGYKYTWQVWVSCLLFYPVFDSATDSYSWQFEEVEWHYDYGTVNYGRHFTYLPDFDTMFADVSDWEGNEAWCFDLQITIERCVLAYDAADVNPAQGNRFVLGFPYMHPYSLPTAEDVYLSYPHETVLEKIEYVYVKDDYSGFGTALTSIVGSFLDVQIFPGFALSNLLQFLFGAFVVFLVIKMFGR